MRIATWNVNGIRARAAQLCEWLERDRPDVVCLQEIKATPEQVPEACKLLDYYAFWHGERAYSGVSLHIRKGLFDTEPVFTHPDFDMETRIVTAQFANLVLASVYVPNGGKDYPAKLDFLKRLVAWTRQLYEQRLELVLCGDINIAHTDRDVHPKERKPGVIGQRPEERALFDELLGEHLVDVQRALAPGNDAMFTWWPPWRNMRQGNIGWRIDYILASKTIAARASSCPVLADVGTSDHAPVIMTIDKQGNRE
ncbi:MAG: exodeoxyribonuclease III [Betaproteobacteria bacterium RIFCSPLOWO2_12_FULL_66_14]|nr:MAG: exodeoxyribonuclease III [Betaproteobacteria bacterium RIFCSPLOWO2_12_FULL_66_14]